MNIAICIGGTGVRCFEAFLYSIAAGQIAEDIEKKITVLIIDKDKNCKTVSDCKAAISAYKSMRDTLREGGVDTSFAEIQVEEYTDWDLDEIIKTMVPPGNDVTLKNAVGPSSDNKLLDAMFSDKEQNVPLDQGFYGHPAIGSILFNRVIADHPLGLVEEVRRELSGVGSSSKIFIFGSVFGGTGAAILPHIARLFKDIDNRVVVGGVMMLPYFKVPSSINSQYLDVIDDNTFLQKTLTALEHYNGPGYKIVKNAPSDSGYCFDTLYVIGMAPRASTTVKYAEGGSDQYSHKHFVDMFAAIAACDFFSRKTNNEKEGVYALRIFSQDDVRDDIDWSCIPNIGDSSDLRIKLLQLLRFATVVIEYLDKEAEMDEHANSQLMKALYGANTWRKKSYTKNDIETVRNKVKNVRAFCTKFIDYIYDLTMSDYDWSRKQIDSSLPACRLFDITSVEKIHEYTIDSKKSSEYSLPVTQLADFAKDQLGSLSIKDISDALSCIDPKTEQITFGKLLNKIFNTCGQELTQKV